MLSSLKLKLWLLAPSRHARPVQAPEESTVAHATVSDMSVPPASTAAEPDIKRGEYQPFPFLELPGELRNRIYRMVLLTEDKRIGVLLTEDGYARPPLLRV